MGENEQREPVGHGINVPLLRKTLEHITAHPEEHNQDYWGFHATHERPTSDVQRCGTTACMAGWTCLLADSARWADPDEEGVAELVAVDDAGVAMTVSERAKDLLGLSSTQAMLLFFDAQDAEGLWLHASVFTDGEIEVPAGLPPICTDCGAGIDGDTDTGTICARCAVLGGHVAPGETQ